MFKTFPNVFFAAFYKVNFFATSSESLKLVDSLASSLQILINWYTKYFLRSRLIATTAACYTHRRCRALIFKRVCYMHVLFFSFLFCLLFFCAKEHQQQSEWKEVVNYFFWKCSENKKKGKKKFEWGRS